MVDHLARHSAVDADVFAGDEPRFVAELGHHSEPLRLALDDVGGDDFAVECGVRVAVRHRECAGNVGGIARLAIRRVESIQVLLLGVYDLALECQRQFLEARHGNHLRLDGRKPCCGNLVHVTSRLRAANAENLSVERTDGNVDCKLRVLREEFVREAPLAHKRDEERLRELDAERSPRNGHRIEFSIRLACQQHAFLQRRHDFVRVFKRIDVFFRDFARITK